jgi:hypothetical protein
MTGFSELGKGILVSIEEGFLRWLKNCQLLKKDPAVCSSSINRSEMNLRALPVCGSPLFIWAIFRPCLAGGISNPQARSKSVNGWERSCGRNTHTHTHTLPLTRHVHRLYPSASSTWFFTCQKLTNNLHRLKLLPKYMLFLGFSEFNHLQHSGYYMYHLL